MRILEFIKGLSRESSKWVAFTELEPHELEALKDALRKTSAKLHVVEIKKQGISPETESEFLGLDLFQERKVFLFRLVGHPSEWSGVAQATLHKLLDRSGPHASWLWIMAESDVLASLKPPLVVQSGEGAAEQEWLEFWNAMSVSPLDAPRLRHILLQEAENFSDKKSWIELWKLGGDEWAAHALGWTAGDEKSPHPHQSVMPQSDSAFAWVDAAINGRRRQFLELTDHLLEKQGEDPIRLWALLGKSIKILSQINLGEQPVGEPPFLVNKLKRVPYDRKLLTWWCDCDLNMKGGRANVKATIESLPTTGA